MSSTIADLTTYGDAKGRDNYMRNSYFSVKGDGVNPNELTQGFYGIPSGTSTEYELMRMTVTEGAVDDEVGTVTFGVRDGTSLNDVMSLSNAASTITTTTLNLAATDVVATGNLNVGTILKNDLAEGASIELVDDALDPAINFILGDLAGTPSTPLVITESTVAVTGSLTINGTDVLDSITNGNPWESTGTVTQLKSDYNSVEINVANAYTTSVALDVNGSTRIRGNDLFFYDEPLTTFYSALAYVESAGELRLRASRAGDSVVIATSNGTDNTYLDRLTFTDGAGTQSASFTNVNLGVGAAPSGTYTLEVTGNANITTGLVSGGNVDLSGNNLVNVTQIESDDSLAEQARIVLTSSATDPQIDLVLGDLDTAPVTAATFTETSADINVPTTINDNLTVTGDFTVQGTTTTLQTTELDIFDTNINLGNNATLATEINGGGITLGPGVTGTTVPTLTYNSTSAEWEMSVGLSLEATSSLTVGTSSLDTNGLSLNASSPILSFGQNSQWHLEIYTDGSGEHFVVSHDDLGTQTTWVPKLDVLA